MDPRDLKDGMRVRATCNVERFPHFIVPKESWGVLVAQTYNGADSWLVKVDELIEGMEEWDNEVVYDPSNGDDCVLEEWEAFEILPRFDQTEEAKRLPFAVERWTMYGSPNDTDAVVTEHRARRWSDPKTEGEDARAYWTILTGAWVMGDEAPAPDQYEAISWEEGSGEGAIDGIKSVRFLGTAAEIADAIIYRAFCKKHNLDPNLTPDLNHAECNEEQMWEQSEWLTDWMNREGTGFLDERWGTCAVCGALADFGARGDGDAISFSVLVGASHPLEKKGTVIFCGDGCCQEGGLDPRSEYFEIGRSLDDLCDELKAFCDKHGYEPMSADELQNELIIAKHRDSDGGKHGEEFPPAKWIDPTRSVEVLDEHIEWLSDFIERWNAAEEAHINNITQEEK